jgi:hypothetical protein
MIFLEDGDVVALDRTSMASPTSTAAQNQAEQDRDLDGWASGKGRLSPLHAQGDPRAAPGGKRYPAQPPAPRQQRRQSGRPGSRPSSAAGDHPGLRNLVPRGAGRQVPRREHGPHPCEVDLASEFRYREPVVGAQDLVVAISQSGETADTLAAVKEAKARGARTLAICNVVDSAIARLSDWCSIPTPARRSASPPPSASPPSSRP